MRQAPAFLHALRGHVPPCVIFAVINTWLNGWCTARRFQRGEHHCCIGQCSGADELEHYVMCPFFRGCALHFLDINFRIASLAQFLGVDGVSGHSTVLTAIHMYATRAVVHRHNLQRIYIDDADKLRNLYRERLRHLAGIDGNLGRIIRKM